jgi:hypothetical protein
MTSALRLREIAGRLQRELALAPPAHLRVKGGADERPVLPEQSCVEEAGNVVAAALGEHDAVHAPADPVIGEIELAHPRPRQVPREHDNALDRAAQFLEPLRQPASEPAAPGEHIG